MDAWMMEEVGRTRGQVEEKRRQLVGLEEHEASIGQALQQAGVGEEQVAAKRARLAGGHRQRKELLQERAALRRKLGDHGADLTGLRGWLAKKEAARALLGRFRGLAGSEVLRGWQSVQAVLAGVPGSGS
jgi:hypothetical protein